MRIGIEMNHIVRDINSQILKYFVKDIQKDFDESEVDLHTINFIKQIPFKTAKEKHDFLFVDYPYEIFGCASSTAMHLPVMVNDWGYKLGKKYQGEKFDISYFSLGEKGLSIQSSFFFLSKTASRIRDVFFPLKVQDVWDRYDVVITTNQNVIKHKPKGKVVIGIKMSDNLKILKKADLVYDDLPQLIEDDTFIDAINGIMYPIQENLISKFKITLNKVIKKFFKNGE